MKTILYSWSDINLNQVKAINYWLSFVKKQGTFEQDIVNWTNHKKDLLEKYANIMTHIESFWDLYGAKAQEIYDAASLAYLLLGGKMEGEDIDSEIARLTKIYYRMEN